MILGIVELYCGASGKKGFYNSQEIGMARGMKKKGHTCVIFYPRPEASEISEEVVEDGITIVSVPAKHIGVHGKYDWSVFRKYHIDVAQIGSDNQLFAADAVSYCERNHILVYLYIGTVGSNSEKVWKRKVMRFLSRKNLRMMQTYQCFVKTEAVKRVALEYGIENSVVAPVGLDQSVIPLLTETKEQMKERLQLTAFEKVVIFIGRLDPYKRPLEALTLIEELPKNYGLIMIGDGTMNEAIEQRIQEKKLENRIRKIRKIPNTEIYSYLAVSDYFVNFNQEEIFGMAILEAMYAGCTVIANHAPGPDEIIQNEVSGLLVNTTKEMKDLIETGRKIDPREAKKRIEESFSWEATAGKIDAWMQKQKS